MSTLRVTVIGAGVAGLVCALELAERGADVEVIERGAHLGERACSWSAGGMLAPWCERESAEPAVADLGQAALDWWPRHYPGTCLLYTSPSPRDRQKSRMPSSA